VTMPDLSLDLAAQLTASIEGLTAAMRREADWRMRQMNVIRQIPFAGSIPIAGGFGALDQPDSMQAKAGFVWGVRRLTVQGFSAGTVTAYRNGYMTAATGLNPGEPVLPYPAPAVNTLGKGQLLLMPNDRINFGATGITLASGYGQIQIWGVADCMESWYLPYYLG
jgi:hypothetical protein